MTDYSITTHSPLEDYPWKSEIPRLVRWAASQEENVAAFCYDLVMSMAYIDALPDFNRYLEACPNIPGDYNCHLGFINLCSPCLENSNKWIYQKAAKPMSAVLGKLSSELTLLFIKELTPNLQDVRSAGGTDLVDAVLYSNNGIVILGEVKAAPLITYPLILKRNKSVIEHESVTLTSSQFKACHTGLYMHDRNILPLGKPDHPLWPFKPCIDFITARNNAATVLKFVHTWNAARDAYKRRNKSVILYYLANASGKPPKIALERDGWPKTQSISDSKTSAGLDRTDDIKKGIYQVLKIGTAFQKDPKVKTALISNLPAYRHGEEYIDPFTDMVWAKESTINNSLNIPLSATHRVFDYIITLDESLLRGVDL